MCLSLLNTTPATHFAATHCAATHCNARTAHTDTHVSDSQNCSVLQCVAVCCSVLQCVAVCCSVLQCVHTDTPAPCKWGERSVVWTLMQQSQLKTTTATHSTATHFDASHCTATYSTRHTYTHTHTHTHTFRECRDVSCLDGDAAIAAAYAHCNTALQHSPTAHCAATHGNSHAAYTYTHIPLLTHTHPYLCIHIHTHTFQMCRDVSCFDSDAAITATHDHDFVARNIDFRDP